MSQPVQHKLCVLWEHEIRLAAKAIRAYYDAEQEGSGVTEAERGRLAVEAVNATLAALWDVDDASALVLSAAPARWRRKRP